MLHKKLPDHWALISGSQPFDDYSFESNHVQIIYNCTNEPWADDSAHYHQESDEIYIILEGAMDIEVDGNVIRVQAGEYLCIPKGDVHRLVGVVTPHKSFVIRGPSVKDKVAELS